MYDIAPINDRDDLVFAIASGSVVESKHDNLKVACNCGDRYSQISAIACLLLD
ncbi:MAG: hypothetical protein AB4038_22150 [Prochloraceae cyanobacterium]